MRGHKLLWIAGCYLESGNMGAKRFEIPELFYMMITLVGLLFFAIILIVCNKLGWV